MERDKLLRTGQAAAFLGISKYRLNVYRKEKKIKAEHIGRNRYYTGQELLRFKPILEKLSAPSPFTLKKKQQALNKMRKCGTRPRGKPPANSPLQEGMSLCWNCTRVYSGCSWARTQTPVKGWDAVLLDNEEYPAERGVYRVKNCPEFEWDEHYYDTQGILRRKKEMRNSEFEIRN